MADESALLPQSVHHIQEDENKSIPTDANFLPFADTVEVYDWTPDIPINVRKGIGSIDVEKIDRGQESHTFTVDFPLQGSIAAADIGGTGEVNAEPVYEAIVRLANRKLERRSIIWKVEHPGEGIASAGRDVYVVARHCVPDSLTLSGDPEENSPITVSLEYMAPKIRPYTLDQPGSSNTIDVESTVVDGTDDIDVTIEGEDAGSAVEETVTLASGTATTTATFDTIFAVYAEAKFTGDISVATTTEGNTLMTLNGAETYWGVEADRGIPTLPDTGERIDTHGGTEQKFLNNEITVASNAIAPEYNSVELEIANNIEGKNVARRLGQELRANTRDITLTATVGGQKQANVKAKSTLQKILATLTWNLDLDTLEIPNAAVSDPGSKVFNSEEAFAMVDVEFTGKGITINPS